LIIDDNLFNMLKVEIIIIGLRITSLTIPTQDDTPYPKQSQKQKEPIAQTPQPWLKDKNE
jgi:hypothetical protein